MKKKIIIAASLVLAITVAIFCLFTFLDHQKQEKAKQEREKYENYFYYTGQWEIDSYKFLDDGRGVVVHWKSLSPEEDNLYTKYNPQSVENRLGAHGASNQKYIVRKFIKILKNKSRYEWPKDDSEGYYKLSINKIYNKHIEKDQVDLYQLVKKYNKNYFPEETGGIEEIGGKDYLPIKTYITTENKRDSKILWLNLETKKIEWEDSKEQSGSDTPSVALGQLKVTLDNATKPFRTTNAYDDSYQNQLTFFPNNLKGSILEKSDPKAYQLLRKKNSQLYIQLDAKLHYDEVYGNVQQFIDLYQLFVPANTNLYEGITIPAELSKDGQVHQINTKEEFETYYDVDKDNELNKQRRVLVDQNQISSV